jgi:hypothetical protein
MKRGNFFKALEWVKVVFGEGHLDRYVVAELKYLAAIYWNVWNVVQHDRFHQHAFPAVSIGVKGYYDEEVLLEDGTKRVDRYQAPWVRFIPRSHNHRMLKSSPGAVSITVAGPWDRLWTEEFLDGSKRVLTWGRKEVCKQEAPKPPVDLSEFYGGCCDRPMSEHKYPGHIFMPKGPETSELQRLASETFELRFEKRGKR